MSFRLRAGHSRGGGATSGNDCREPYTDSVPKGGGRVTQRLECNPYKVEVAGSNPAVPIQVKRVLPGARGLRVPGEWGLRLRIRERQHGRGSHLRVPPSPVLKACEDCDSADGEFERQDDPDRGQPPSEPPPDNHHAGQADE
jgi:hypothetical protein